MLMDKPRKYEAGLIPLLYGVLPHLTARPYVQAREALVRAFLRYYEEDGPTNSDASPLIKDHYKIHSSNGVPLEDMARLEVAISIAIISNTMPASFWLIYHIFSDPVVLEDCRKELSEGVRTHDGVHTIDITYVKNQCPIFLSTFQETFRVHSTSVASRVVLEDHVLNGQYLLKKAASSSFQAVFNTIWTPHGALMLTSSTTKGFYASLGASATIQWLSAHLAADRLSVRDATSLLLRF